MTNDDAIDEACAETVRAILRVASVGTEEHFKDAVRKLRLALKSLSPSTESEGQL